MSVEVTLPEGSSGVLQSLRAEPPERTTAVCLYELAVILPLLAWLGWSFTRAPAEVSDPLLLEWIVAIAIVDMLPVPTPVGFPFSLSFPLQLSVALIYPAPVAGVVALLGSSDAREFRRQIPFLQGVWNRSQIAWSVVIESLLFHQLGSLKSPWFGLGPAVLLCAFVGYAVNTLLVALYLHIRTGQPTLGILRQMHVGVFGEFVLSYMGLALFAVIVATTFVRIGPWSIAVFIAPLAFARQMFTRTQSLQEATVELEARQQENAYQALHDALTDLPNRALFQSSLRETIESRSKRDGHELVAVMLMDLDHFKEINDTLGHHFGDLLLQEIGPRLSTVLRDEDLLARLGGDEFGILLPNIPDVETAIGVAERILEELEKPLSVEGLQLDVTGSIGIAIYPQHSRDVQQVSSRFPAVLEQGEQGEEQETAAHVGHVEDEDPTQEVEDQAGRHAPAPSPDADEQPQEEREDHEAQRVVGLEKEGPGPGHPECFGVVEGGGTEHGREPRHQHPLPRRPRVAALVERAQAVVERQGKADGHDEGKEGIETQDALRVPPREHGDEHAPERLEVELPHLGRAQGGVARGHHLAQAQVADAVVAGPEGVKAL